MNKKLAAIIAAFLLLVAACCAGVFVMLDQTLLKYDGAKVSITEAEVYARIQEYTLESEYGSYFGEKMWQTNVEDGVSLEDATKKEAIETIVAIKVLVSHAEELGIYLDETEKSAIDSNAESFADSDVGKKIMEISGADIGTIKAIYEDNALADKVKNELYKKADTKISDKEATVKSVYKLVFSTKKIDANGEEVELSDQEKEKQKAKATKAYKQAKAGADFTFLAKQYDVLDTLEENYGTGRAVCGKEFEEAVDKLKPGGITKVLETPQGYVVAMLRTANNEQYTDSMKETIWKERQQAVYEEQYAQWTADKSFDYDKNVSDRLWKKVVFNYGELTKKDK
ncbi:MAG: peptidylprolyl isomerase [Lachnospiraceae bacterium]|nr:peptidylprolyl isomerase [Lachnospiraceae bacterium]